MPIYLTDGRTGLEIIPKVYEDSILVHYGIKGQKHGIRRWQNEDGSLTPEGYIHYGVGQGNKQKSDTKEEVHKNLGQKIKERIQSMYLPPHMIGKSKEEIEAKSGSWYWNKGVSDGFKKITDTVDDLRSQIQSVREQIYRDVPDSTKRYKQMNNDPRIIHLETQIKGLQSKLPEQVLKDLGVPVTSENVKSITPFVFWD